MALIIALGPWIHTCLGDLELGLIKSGFDISQPTPRISAKKEPSIPSSCSYLASLQASGLCANLVDALAAFLPCCTYSETHCCFQSMKDHVFTEYLSCTRAWGYAVIWMWNAPVGLCIWTLGPQVMMMMFGVVMKCSRSRSPLKEIDHCGQNLMTDSLAQLPVDSLQPKCRCVVSSWLPAPEAMHSLLLVVFSTMMGCSPWTGSHNVSFLS